MINLNFFEKKEINILPYIVGGTFLLLLILMSAYFFFARMFLTDSISSNQEWVDEHTEAVALSEQMKQLDQQYEETMAVQKQLENAQYPMYKIAVEIAESVPDELIRLSSFNLADPNQLILTLENTEAIMAQKIVENIESLPYVTELQLLYAESQGADDAQLRYELIVNLDQALLVEEGTE